MFELEEPVYGSIANTFILQIRKPRFSQISKEVARIDIHMGQ